jgi:RNA-dependent RNA polymerase
VVDWAAWTNLGYLSNDSALYGLRRRPSTSCFLKHDSRFSWAKRIAEVIVGTVVVAKNPCLHPGDVRILEAVDVPELHDLVDCLVFPKKGERPHANEASGSDLDGNVYSMTLG